MRSRFISLMLAVVMLMISGCGSEVKMTTTPDEHQAGTADKKREDAGEDAGDDAEDAESTAKNTSGSDGVSGASLFSGSTDGKSIQLINTYFDESRYDESSSDLYFQCFGNHILCTFEMEKAYPRLAAELNKIADNEEKSMRDRIREFEKDAQDYARDMKKSGVKAYYSDYAEDVLKRADERCVSIIRVVNGFLGGAHPDYYFETYNISSKTGERIRLSDVVTDQKKLNDVLEKKLTEDYPDVEFFDLKESLGEYDMSITEGKDEDDGYHYAYDFTLDPDGVSFYFSPYGISAYAFGSQVVKILYSEEPSLFKEDYAMKEGYVSYFIDLDNKYDIGGDVKSVSIDKSDFDENGYFTSFDVTMGEDKAGSGETYCYGLRSFIVHTGDGRDYAYIITNMDSDYKDLYVADLGGSGLTCSKTDDGFSYTYKNYLNEDSGVYGEVLPTAPDELQLAVRCDLLSTYNAYGSFKPGAKGFPELIGEYLMVPDRFTLISKEDVKADIVDEEGRTAEKDADISKGGRFTLYRTDGREIVDATLPDGRIVRFKVTGSYPHMVNDTIDEEKLFDDLFYAG